MSDALFRREGGLFVPGDKAASPWGAGLLHGGAPAALLAHGVEQAKANPALFVSRLTIDLFRPVPKAPLELRTKEIRTGRRIQVLESSLWHEDVETCRATALLLMPSEVSLPETARFRGERLPGPAGIETGSLVPAAMRRPGMPEGLHTAIEVKRITPPNMGSGGRQTAWIRFPMAIVGGQPTTPLMRVAGTADFGNGLANIRVNESAGFINADINVHLHREARGEWVCLDAHSAAEPHGLGMIVTTVYDEDGPIGHCVQSTMANPR